MHVSRLVCPSGHADTGGCPGWAGTGVGNTQSPRTGVGWAVGTGVGPDAVATSVGAPSPGIGVACAGAALLPPRTMNSAIKTTMPTTTIPMVLGSIPFSKQHPFRNQALHLFIAMPKKLLAGDYGKTTVQPNKNKTVSFGFRGKKLKCPGERMQKKKIQEPEIGQSGEFGMDSIIHLFDLHT